MIKKFICFIWGHKTTHRAATGDTTERNNPLTGAHEIVPLYALVRVPFCERCGDKVHEDGETLSYPRTGV